MTVFADWRAWRAQFIPDKTDEECAPYWRAFASGYVCGCNAIAGCLHKDKATQLERLLDHAETMVLIPELPHGPPDHLR